MTYIIDGHNLIPHIPGLYLADMDDEDALITQLQVFHRVSRRAVEVFFDNAPAGHSGKKRKGLIDVHYVRAGRTADDAILKHLKDLGKGAKNVTVVSSDRQVAAGARSYHADVKESPVFARELQAALAHAQKTTADESPTNEDEVTFWLDQFTRNKGKKP
jgi:predicted RNA-binding protein with PIN domain